MRRFLIAAMFGLSFVAQADEVTVGDAWTRATAPGQDSGMVQAVITSKQAAKLVGASCSCARTVELHSMVHEGGMMKMRQVDAIDLPAGKAVDLGAAGYHLMLIGLKEPVKEGRKIELQLQLRQADGKEKRIQVHAMARGLTDSPARTMHDAGSGMGGSHDHGMHGHQH